LGEGGHQLSKDETPKAFTDYIKSLEFNECLDALKNLSKFLKAYYDSLIAEGFENEQALVLVVNLQAITMNPNNNN
jgi:hypothetical protein